MAYSGSLFGLPYHQGSWFGLPDFGVTENFTSNKTAQGGSNLFGGNSYASSTQPTYNTSTGLTNSTTGGAIDPSIIGNPQTSGGGGGGGGGTGGGFGSVLGAATSPSNFGSSQLDIIRALYDNARNYLTSEQPIAESSYNNSVNDVNNSIKDAENTYNTQDQQNTVDYGKILRSQIQNYNDLGQRTNNLYSGNNALDSSQYQDATLRNQQNLNDAQANTQTEQQRSHNSLQGQFNTYKNSANSYLNQLNGQYNEYKNAVQKALNDNNIQEAQDLSQAAEAIKGNMINWATQAALLKNQGVDVMGALKGITSQAYGDNALQKLADSQREFGSLLNSNIGSQQGQGYSFTGKSGKTYRSYQDALAAGDI